MNHSIRSTSGGFTLIELSIVLVIIGLIIGSVLVGRDLVKAAEVRATITQIERFNTAANTFFEKYGYLPGDIPAVPAAQFGFAARGPYAGQGDGNGVLDGYSGGAAPHAQCAGETPMFWVDLSTARLIDGNFSTASSTVGAPLTTWTTTPNLTAYFPTAKLGNSDMFYVTTGINSGIPLANIPNYFGLAAIYDLGGTNGCELTMNPGLTVAQAYAIDMKADDGLPGQGNIFVVSQGNPPIYINNGHAVSPTSLTCFDNNGNSANTLQYSVTQSNGANVNCTINFRMQAGD
jgi:prepilin-type N-terminal cleavage/methylation domain-containing protein